MKRIVRFKDGIIPHEVMKDVVEVFPELKDNFKQRKTFLEYYYTSKDVIITLEAIEKLTDWYVVDITLNSFTINY
jgi:adenosine deaminase